MRKDQEIIQDMVRLNMLLNDLDINTAFGYKQTALVLARREELALEAKEKQKVREL